MDLFLNLVRRRWEIKLCKQGMNLFKRLAARTGAKRVLDDVKIGTGDEPIHDMGVGDSHFEDYPGHDFEKVGEFTPEETPSSAEPRRKKFKTLAGRMDLPWVRKLITWKSKTSSSSQQTSQK